MLCFCRVLLLLRSAEEGEIAMWTQDRTTNCRIQTLYSVSSVGACVFEFIHTTNTTILEVGLDLGTCMLTDKVGSLVNLPPVQLSKILNNSNMNQLLMNED